ncbi:MAG TPA: hypothetical protein VMZ90_04540 [Vicinamibacterales bacterium]|nr:hypothetical protein [Vicinamibacterales bacterium]
MTPEIVCRKLRRVSFSTKKTPDVIFLGIVFALLLGASEVALACPICFRVEENATTDGAQAAVLVLVGITTVVLGAFARFIAGFVKRESQQSREPEC